MFGTLLAPHLVDWYIDIYTNIYGVDLTYSEIILRFNQYLKQMINGASFDAFSDIVMSIGIILMLFYFFSDLSEKAAMNQLSMLQTGKSVCAAVAALFVIFHTKNIFIFMLTFVESLNEDLSAITAPGSERISAFLSNDIVRVLLSRCVGDHFSMFEILGYTLLALLLFLISLCSRIYITYYSATRIIQLFVYYVFAPIGVADIFENGPGGTINWNSSGFRYLKTMFAIMLQVVVITITCQTFTLVSSQIQSGYFDDQGDPSLHTGIDILDNWALNRNIKNAAEYPLKNFEYTDHTASILEVAESGLNKVKNFLLSLGKKLFGGGDSDAEEEYVTKEKLKDSEKHKVTNVVDLDGSIRDSGEATAIMNNSKYRMTVDSAKIFFDWCTGSDGAKLRLFIILIVTKVLMVSSSAKLCGYVTGTSV